MAQVPQNTGPQVMPQGVQPGQNIPVDPEAFGTGVGRAVQGVGAAVGQMGDVLAQHAQTMMALEQNAVADDGVTKYTDLAVKQRLAFQQKAVGANANGATLDSALQDMETARQSVRDGMSPYAARLYDQQSRRITSGLKESMESHVATESQKWQKTTALNNMDSVAQIAQFNPTEDNLNLLRDTVTKQTGIIASQEGDDPSKASHTTMSKYMVTIARTKAVTDPVEAQQWTEAHKDDFQGNDWAVLSEYLHTRTAPFLAEKVGDEQITNLKTAISSSGLPPQTAGIRPDLVPLAAKAATKYGIDLNTGLAILKIESSGGFNLKDNGISAGVLQDQPEALKDIGFTGDIHDPAQAIDAGFHVIATKANDLKTRLGRDISPAETFLAQNQGAAGAEALIKAPVGQTAVAALEAAGVPKAKAEASITKNGGTLTTPAADFVSHWNQRFGAGGALGAGDKIKQLDEAIEPALEASDAHVDAVYGGDPDIKARARAKIMAWANQQKAALGDSARASAMTVTAALMGDPLHNMPGPTTLNELLQNPDTAGAYANLTIPEKKQVEVDLKKNSDAEFKLQHPSTKDLLPGDLQNYQNLDGQAKTDPASFMGVNLTTDPRASGLPNNIKLELMRQQDNIRAGKIANPALNRAMTVVNPLLKEAGIDLTSDKDKYFQFGGAMAANVQDYVALNGGKAPDDLTVKKWATDLLATSGGMFDRKFGFEGNDHSTLVPGVPDKAVHNALAQAKAAGVRLTQADVQAGYAEWKKSHGGR